MRAVASCHRNIALRMLRTTPWHHSRTGRDDSGIDDGTLARPFALKERKYVNGGAELLYARPTRSAVKLNSSPSQTPRNVVVSMLCPQDD